MKNNEEKEHHLKILKLKGKTGNMIGLIGPNRAKEIVNILKSKLPYKEGHVLKFLNNGELTKQPYIDNCIFSEGNENISYKKLLKGEGANVKIKSKNKGIEITQCSGVGARTYSLKLEG